MLVRLPVNFRVLGYAILCVALIAPKISLAITGIFSDGYRVVVVCTGSGLTRVTISPDGSIVEDVSESWVSPHCLPVTADVEFFQRAWAKIAFPRFSKDNFDNTMLGPVPRLQFFSQISNRGPPYL